MAKTAIILAEGFEEIEALTVVDVLRRGNVQCITCSLKDYAVSGSHNIRVTADVLINELNFHEVDAVILPGGMPGALNLKNDDRVIKLIKNFNENRKLVCAICAAPIVLKAADIIDNVRITSYPDVKEQLKGCIYSEDAVVQDGNLITSRGPATAMSFAYKILENFIDSEKVSRLKSSMLFI